MHKHRVTITWDLRRQATVLLLHHLATISCVLHFSEILWLVNYLLCRSCSMLLKQGFKDFFFWVTNLNIPTLIIMNEINGGHSFLIMRYVTSGSAHIRFTSPTTFICSSLATESRLHIYELVMDGDNKAIDFILH